MRIEIAKLHADLGATMVYVTHDQVEAMTLADKIVVLNAGRVEQIGAPLDLYHRPANLFVAGFIGSPRMNIIESEVREIAPEGVRCALPGGGSVLVPVDPDRVRPGDPVTLGIRPEHLLDRGSGDAELRGTAEVVEQLGESHLVHVRIGSGRIVTLRASGDARVRAGEPAMLGIPAGACHVFDREGRALDRRFASGAAPRFDRDG